MPCTVTPLGRVKRANIFRQSIAAVGQALRQGSQSATQWFRGTEVDLQQVLEQVRQRLPATEVILIGKAQTGKSSIIQAMTGTSAEIVGQGFRPHTAHTQRYAYPTDDLPLLNFIDTVGLGEGLRNPQAVASELQGLLQSAPAAAAPADTPVDVLQAAQILIVTLKITDFAVDSVYRLLRDLRRTHPQVPCLGVITCLHDLYPPTVTEHPPHPPSDSEIQRAIAALQTQFQTVCDRFVYIDFTQAEDGYSPVLYGLESFVDAVATLLPTAEAEVIHQLIDQAGVGDAIGNLYRDAGRRYILPFSIMAATVAAVPLPFTTMPVLTALQASLVTLLGRLYGQTLTPAQAGGLVSAIAGGFAAQAIGRELIKFIPGFGSVVAASWAAAYTWALGEGACVYFGDLMGGKKPDPERIQSVMQDAFKEAQGRFKGMFTQSSKSS
jgi:uncharacterized protein (DUF697 family)/predicted GTPase